MPFYSYQAFTKQGRRTSGIVDAPTLQSAREQILAKQIYPISISLQSQATASGGSFFARLFRRSVSLKDLIFFTKQLGVLLNSGVPLVGALDLLVEQSEGSLRAMVLSVRDMVREGKSLAEALSTYPKVFENIYIQLVRAGEASGKLEVILKRLLEFLERRAQMRAKVVSAMRTPLIQLGIIVLVAGGLLIFVVPNLVQTFVSSGIKDLPFLTSLMLGLSRLLTTYYLYVIGALIALFIGIKAWARSRGGKRMLDKIKLKLPILGYFARMQTVVQFSRTLGMLIEAGVNLPEALDIVSHIVDNSVLVEALEQAREQIIKQGKMAEYLRQTNLFPAVAIYLINTGEQSGTLDQMLLSVSEYYERELNEYADSLTAIINPIMLIFTGLVVGSIILAIILPMTQMGAGL